MKLKPSISRYRRFAVATAFAVFVASSLFAQEAGRDADSAAQVGQMEDLSLADLLNLKVTTASRHAESRDEAPNVVYSIGKEEIRKYGYRSVQDILNRLPGFFTSFRPLEPIAQVRGIAPNENNKITYMINGHRVNNVNESTDLIPPYNLDNCERVEIIVGPGSMLYGPETLCAIVNMITKSIEGQEVVGSYGHETASARGFSAIEDYTVMATAMYGARPYEDVSVFASGTFAQAEGWMSEGFYRHSGEKIAGESGDVLARRIGTIRPSGFFFGNAQIKGMNVQFSSLNQAIPEYSQNREAYDKIATRFNYVDAMEATKEFKVTDQINALCRMSYDNRRMLRAIESSPNDFGGILDVHQKLYKCEFGGVHQSDKSFFQFGFQGSLGNNRHNYNINGYNPAKPGGNSYDDLVMDSVATKKYYHLGPNDTLQLKPGDTVISVKKMVAHPAGVESIVENVEDYTIGAYISEKYKLFDMITLVGAVRADHSNLSRDRRDSTILKVYVSPRFAIITKPIDDIILKVMYNTATKFPSPWESRLNQLWNFDKGANWADSVRGPAYNPERLTAYEAQAIFYLHAFGESRIAVNGYYQQLDDIIDWGKSFTNIGDYNGYGLELDLQFLPATFPMQFWGNFATNSNQYSPFDKGGDHGSLMNPETKEMNAVPRFTGTLGAAYDFLDRTMHVSATVRAFTGQVARTYPLPNHVMSSDGIKAYADSNFVWTTINNIVYLDAAYTWDKAVFDNSGFRLSVKNLLNNQKRVAMQYANGDYQPQGRYVEATLFVKF